MEAVKDEQRITLIDNKIEIPSKLEQLGQNLQAEMRKHQEQIMKKKEALITNRAKEINPNYDPEAEKDKRFKSLMVERTPEGHEVYYFNDGTEQGKRLITFVTSEPKMEPTSEDMSKITYSYEVSYF